MYLPYTAQTESAFYLAQDGEIDLLPLMLHCFRQGRRCFLPVLGTVDDQKLNFAEWVPGMAMVKNRFGIAEPSVHTHQLSSAADMEPGVHAAGSI